MSYSDFEKAMALVSYYPKSVPANSVTDEMIRSAEDRLGLRFSKQYIEFCKAYDCLLIDDECYGSVLAGNGPVIDAVLEIRKEGFPEHWLPLWDGVHVYIDFSAINSDGEPRIIEAEYVDLQDGNPLDSDSSYVGGYIATKVVNSDLGEFLLEQMWEAEFQEKSKHQARMDELMKTLLPFRHRFVSDFDDLFYIKPDGTVGLFGTLKRWLRPVMQWRDLVSVKKGWDHFVALLSDGTVLSTGRNHMGQCNTLQWRDIIAIEAIHNITVGLRRDGTVCVCGDIDSFKCSKMRAWNHVVQLCAGSLELFGLCEDGTVVSTCYNPIGCENWKGIKQLCCAGGRLVGINSEFKLQSCVESPYTTDVIGDLGDWDQIVALYGSENELFAIQCDGSLLRAGRKDQYLRPIEEFENVVAVVCDFACIYVVNYDGEVQQMYKRANRVLWNVDQWKNVKTVSNSYLHCVGICSDGTVVATGNDSDGQCRVEDWSGIVALAVGDEHTVGLRNDGTVVATGNNNHGQCNVSGWRNVVQIAADESMTFGLRSDGSVLYTGTENAAFSKLRYYSAVKEIYLDMGRVVLLTKDGRVSFYDMGINNPVQHRSVLLWKDICQIAITRHHILGLTRQGKVCVAGPAKDDDGNPSPLLEAMKWTGVKQLAAGYECAFGVLSDGRVCAAGTNDWGEAEVQNWSGVTHICSDVHNALGLKNDGTVLFCGSDTSGVFDVIGWHDVVQIAGSDDCVLGLKNDGTVMVAGQKRDNRYTLSALNVQSNVPGVAERCELERLRLESQAHSWRQAGCCRYCGGKLNLFKKCRSCGLKA